MSPTPALPPPPAVAPPARWRFPDPREHRPGNGVTVLAHHMPGQHAAVVTCRLAIPAAAEPAGCDGIAAVMAASLLTAAGGLPARQFAERAAASGITWTAEAGWAGPAVTLELPAREIAAAMDLLRLALAEPALDPEDVSAQARLAADGIKAAAASPAGRLLQELPAAVYGDGSRAGRPAAGTLATVTRLTPAAITRFYESWVRPATVTIVIAGDLDGLDVAALATEAFATWRDDRPAGDGYKPAPAPLPRRHPAAILVSQPEAAQAQLLLAAPVPGRAHPAWPALHVAARILDAQVRAHAGADGGLTARLTELMPGSGFLLVAGAVDAPAVPAALAAASAALTAPPADGFSDAETMAAAEAVARMAPLACETPAALAAAAASLAASGLDPGYPGRVLDAVAALTAVAVTTACKGHLGQQRLTLAAACDPAAVAGPLRELAGPAALEVISA